MSTPQADQHERTANTPRARTRHGCWTCRKRRRKCDEQKPTCHNCIGRSLKCRYGVQLTFRKANHFKLMPEEARALSEQTPNRYQTVQFVDGMDDIYPGLESESGIDEARNPESATQVDAHQDQHDNMPYAVDTTPPRSVYMISSNSQLLEDTNYRMPNSPLDHHDLGETLLEETSTSNTQTIQSDGPGPSTMVGGQFMNDVNSSPLSPRLIRRGERQQFHNFTRPPISPIGNENALSATAATSNTATHAGEIISKLSPRAPQELMKFYIDKVAPWLDLSTSESTFGTRLPMSSSKFHPLRDAMFALSAAQSSRFEAPETPNINESIHQIMGSEMYSRRDEAIFARTMLEVANILYHPLHSWRSLLRTHVLCLDEIGAHCFQNNRPQAAALLTLRFDLAIAINSQSPTLTNLGLWKASSELPQSVHSTTETAPRIGDAITLCAQVANLAFSHSTEGQANFETWSSLYIQFQHIENSQQPDSLLPLLRSQIGSITFLKPRPHPSSSNIPSEFPLRIHTSRMSFYSSFLLHLTSLFLLMSRPRNIDRTRTGNFKTTTWYAVQICGLSMSNNILWSWDPVVIAVLLHAGQSLSYGAQQKELIQHLRRLEETTAWKISREMHQLEDFWRLSS